jgi:hypothetical protein
MYCPRRRGDSDRLVDLDGRRVVLECSLFTLLTLVKLAVALLGFALRMLLLLCSMLGMRLHHLTLPSLALTKLSLPVCIRLVLWRTLLLLQGLRNAR